MIQELLLFLILIFLLITPNAECSLRGSRQAIEFNDASTLPSFQLAYENRLVEKFDKELERGRKDGLGGKSFDAFFHYNKEDEPIFKRYLSRLMDDWEVNVFQSDVTYSYTKIKPRAMNQSSRDI